MFKALCPVYMAMGMTYDEYWRGPNDMPRMVKHAYDLKRKDQNYWLWLEGLYVYKAIGSFAPFLKAFSTSQPEAYLDRPIAISEAEIKEEEHQKMIKRANEIATYIRKRSSEAAEKNK